MTNKECILYLLEENTKLKKDIKLLENKLKQTLSKSSELMVKMIEIKTKVDFYENLNFLSNDDYGKGFNNAFQIVQGLFNSNIDKGVNEK